MWPAVRALGGQDPSIQGSNTEDRLTEDPLGVGGTGGYLSKWIVWGGHLITFPSNHHRRVVAWGAEMPDCNMASHSSSFYLYTF